MSQMWSANLWCFINVAEMRSQDGKHSFCSWEHPVTLFLCYLCSHRCSLWLYTVKQRLNVVTPPEQSHSSVITEVTPVLPLNIFSASVRLNRVGSGTLQCKESSSTDLVKGQWNRQVHSLWFSSREVHSDVQGEVPRWCASVCLCVEAKGQGHSPNH